VLVVLVLAGAYVTIPWWAPKDLLRDWLQRQLSRQMGLEVRIGQFQLSWADGVEMREVKVASPEGFGPEPLVVVRRIRAELSPVNFFIHRRLAWVKLDQPCLFVRADANGRSNLDALSRIRFDVQADSVSVHRAVATLSFPDQRRPIRMNVADSQFLAGAGEDALGRLTMSAWMDQTGGQAPISLHAAAGTGRQTAAAMTFNYSNIDLQQLQLVELFKMPLKKLGGRCDGSLELQINRRGIVDRFSFNTSISRLDAQPIEGPPLPVIEQAWFRISAAWDTLAPGGGQVHIQSASIRLPGIDLAGQAKVLAGIVTGDFQAIKSMDLEGQLRPAQLAALLTGRPALPGKLEVSGPLVLKNLNLRRVGPVLRFKVVADGTSAAVRRNGHLIKPTGRTLSVQLAGEFDRRSGRLTVDGVDLRLGGNRFSGKGALPSIRHLADLWAGRDRPETPPEAVEELSRLNWQGQWEITELDSLRDIWPVPLEATKLSGSIAGRWAIGHAGPAIFSAETTIAETTRLAVAGQFIKPVGEAVHLRLSGTIEPGSDRGTLKDVDLDLAVGVGRLRVYPGRIILKLQDGAAGPSIDADGTFYAEHIESLLGCWPALSGGGASLNGAITGRYDAQLGQHPDRIHLETDLKHAEIRIGQALLKSDGEGLLARIDYARRDPATPPGTNHLAVELRIPGGKLAGELDFPPAGWKDTAGIRASADITDARRLAKASPLLRDLLAGGRAQGAFHIDAWADMKGPLLEGGISCNADALQYVSPGGERTKAAAVPFRAKLLGRITRKRNGQLAVEFPLASVDIARSRLALAGKAVLDTRGPAAGNKLRLPRIVTAQAKLDAGFVMDESLDKLFPELAELAERYGLAGEATASSELTADEESIRLETTVKADQLAARCPGVVKPAGMPAELEAELTIRRDLSSLRLNNLYGHVGGVGILAAGQAQLTSTSDALPLRLTEKNAQLAVWTRQAESLHRLFPALRPYSLTGDAFVEVRWTDGDGAQIPTALVHADQLTGRYRDKNFALSGQVLLENVNLRDGKVVRAGKVKTDLLQFRLGDSAGWIVADIDDLPHAVSGRIDILGDYINDGDLKTLFGESVASIKQGGRLSASDADGLENLADELISRLRPYLLTADLDVHLAAKRFLTFDASVQEVYDTRQVVLSASVEAGRTNIRYGAALNGGDVTGRYNVHFADPAPVMSQETEYRDVVATRNMQPQLERYFPGNTVKGYFNRNEKLQAPLRNLLAYTMDQRYPLRPVGTAKTVTIDGVVAGRAAPAFVTRIFPGLNLTKYRYKKMTGFAEYRPDGTAVNDMIFSGKAYDVYIEGVTDAQNIGRYQIGLILLGTPQSAQWNHLYKQGRIPILKWKARIEGGKLYDEEVSYPWPNETLFAIFLKNNIFYRIWLMSRRK